METFLKILRVTGRILIAPVLIAVFFIFVLFFIMILISGIIWWLFSWVTGTPIQVTENGKRVGQLIRWKYFPD
jgi:phosphate/sulfate permease